MSIVREVIIGTSTMFPLETMTEAYNNIVKDNSDIENLQMDQTAKDFLLAYKDNFKKFSSFKWEEILPITIETKDTPVTNVKFNFGQDMKKLEEVVKKIISVSKLSKKLRYKKNKSSINLVNSESSQTVLKLFLGAGSRTGKAGGGKKGIGFEVDLVDDLNALAKHLGVYKYPNFVEKIKDKVDEVYGIDLEKVEFIAEQLGGKNQKRNLVFDGKKFTATPSGDIGEVLTDVDIVTKKKRIHLSLKFTSQFYLTNFSITKYLGDMYKVEKSRDDILLYLGFNPKKWSEGYGVPSAVDNELSDAKKIKNLEALLKTVVGYGYIYVVGGGKKDVVEYINENDAIRVLSIIDVGYANPKRKYSFVKFQLKIGNSRYTATMQNRGTSASDGPRYIRVLLAQ